MNKKRKTRGKYVFSRLDDIALRQYEKYVIKRWDNTYNRVTSYAIPREVLFKFYKSLKNNILIDYHTYFINIRRGCLDDNIKTYEVYNYNIPEKHIQKRELSICESFYKFLKAEIKKIHPLKYEILKDSPLMLSIFDELVINYLNSAKNENKDVDGVDRIGGPYHTPYFAHIERERRLKEYVLKIDSYLQNIKTDFENLIKYINQTYDDYRKDNIK